MCYIELSKCWPIINMPISLEMTAFDDISLTSRGSCNLVAPSRPLPESPSSNSVYKKIKMKIFQFVQTAFPNGRNLEITLGAPTKIVMLFLIVFYTFNSSFGVDYGDIRLKQHFLFNICVKRVLSFVTINLMIISMVFHLPYLCIPVITYDLLTLLASIISLLDYFAPVFTGYGDSRFCVPYYFTLFVTTSRMLNTCIQFRILRFLNSYGVKTFSKTG